MSDSTKRCRKCARDLAVSEFNRDRHQPGGLRVWCKGCRKATAKPRTEEQRKRGREAMRRWTERNTELKRDRRRALYLATKEKVREQCRAWQLANPEKVKQFYREYYRRNRDAYLARKQAWKAANRGKTRATQRKYYAKQPDVVRAWVHEYRARKSKAEGSYTADEVQSIRTGQRDRCAYCRKALHGKGCLDHIQPLSRGGLNFARNLQLVCLPCNSSKRDKQPIAFAQQLGRLL